MARTPGARNTISYRKQLSSRWDGTGQDGMGGILLSHEVYYVFAL